MWISIIIKKYHHMFNRNGVHQLSNRRSHEQQLQTTGIHGIYFIVKIYRVVSYEIWGNGVTLGPCTCSRQWVAKEIWSLITLWLGLKPAISLCPANDREVTSTSWVSNQNKLRMGWNSRNLLQSPSTSPFDHVSLPKAVIALYNSPLLLTKHQVWLVKFQSRYLLVSVPSLLIKNYQKLYFWLENPNVRGLIPLCCLINTHNLLGFCFCIPKKCPCSFCLYFVSSHSYFWLVNPSVCWWIPVIPPICFIKSHIFPGENHHFTTFLPQGTATGVGAEGLAAWAAVAGITSTWELPARIKTVVDGGMNHGL